MVIFGAYHSAQRFSDADRLATNPGPGSYPQRSVVEGAPVLRYARKLVEDGCVRPDGSLILFRGRDSWVRGGEGPKVYGLGKIGCCKHALPAGRFLV